MRMGRKRRGEVWTDRFSGRRRSAALADGSTNDAAAFWQALDAAAAVPDSILELKKDGVYYLARGGLPPRRTAVPPAPWQARPERIRRRPSPWTGFGA